MCKTLSTFVIHSNNLDDVRDEWERITLAYEILSDKKQRLKYDRHSALNDPAAALGRVALDTLGWGATNLIKGFVGLGGAAINTTKESIRKMPEQNMSDVFLKVNEMISIHVGSVTAKGTVSSYATMQNEYVMIQNSAMVLSLPTNGVYYDQINSSIYNHELISQAVKMAIDAVTWSMISVADMVVQFGEVAVKHARQELDRQIEEWNMHKAQNAER
jgi:hypothetical protein